jgi:hypothetical protein
VKIDSRDYWEIEETVAHLRAAAKHKEAVFKQQCSLFNRELDANYIKTTVEWQAIQIIRQLQEKCKCK